jgi:decaprenylphospho-beta-D-ribofuranose 2-oxidase
MMNISNARNMPLTGWGLYPRLGCCVYRPEARGQVIASVNGNEPGGAIARGLGRGYGDCALNETGVVVLQEKLNRLIAFDESAGVVECEAGVSLRELVDFLRPRGWMLPVTPGTLQVSVGGAIAADVHGKNQHRDGNFGNHLTHIEMLLADGTVARCSPDQNEELFRATVGGMGLTGVILSAGIRLIRVPSAFVKATWKQTNGLSEALEQLAQADCGQEPYSVAWVDALASGERLGRSVVMRARYANVDELPAKWKTAPYAHPKKGVKTVPTWFPGFLLRKSSVKLFNAAYYWKHRDASVILPHDDFFYPLDSMRHWNRMYGKNGFLQFQSVIPMENAKKAMEEQLKLIAESGRASFLAVLKAFGEARAGMLSFPMKGLTLAIDLPNRSGIFALMKRLDQVVLNHGGRIYLAKDSCLAKEDFLKMYATVLPEFVEIKKRIDPGNRFQSTQSRRLGICDGEAI